MLDQGLQLSAGHKSQATFTTSPYGLLADGECFLVRMKSEFLHPIRDVNPVTIQRMFLVG